MIPVSPADASSAGEGEITCTVTHEGENVPCYLTRGADDKYSVDFTPQGAGTYEIRAFMNDIEVKGKTLYLLYFGYFVYILETDNYNVLFS